MPEKQTGHIFSPYGKNHNLHLTKSHFEHKHDPIQKKKQSQFTGFFELCILLWWVKKSHTLNHSPASWSLVAKLTESPGQWDLLVSRCHSSREQQCSCDGPAPSSSSSGKNLSPPCDTLPAQPQPLCPYIHLLFKSQTLSDCKHC